MRFAASMIMTVIFMTSVMGNSFASGLRVSPAWLDKNLGDPNLVILDVRTPQQYNKSHIKGAVNLPDTLVYQDKKAGGRIVQPATMQKILRERGIHQDKLVVIYDNGALVNAARVFWVLEVYGLRKVRVLSPGFGFWKKQGFPVSNRTTVVKSGKYVVTVNHKRIASKFTTQLAMVDSKQTIVDVRYPKHYRGETSTARRHGHIPGAINIPITQNFIKKNGIKRFRSLAELKKVYAGLPTSGKVLLYCEIGKASSATYLVLRELGYDVSNYDASWREWGNDFKLPIEK